MNTVKEALLRCSFCGKTQDEVKKIIAGPTVYICDECIDLCNEIMEEEYQNEHPDDIKQELLKPAEIKEVLDSYVVGQEQDFGLMPKNIKLNSLLILVIGLY